MGEDGKGHKVSNLSLSSELPMVSPESFLLHIWLVSLSWRLSQDPSAAPSLVSHKLNACHEVIQASQAPQPRAAQCENVERPHIC